MLTGARLGRAGNRVRRVRLGGTVLAAVALLGCNASATPSTAGSTMNGATAASGAVASDGPLAAASGATGETGPPPACSAAPAAVASPPPTSVPGWWRNRVFYEVFVRSFADSNDDGIGDLQGLTDRLDQLNDGEPNTTTDLGISGLWLMPTFPSPSYHGYDVTDYRSVNPDYGSLADMRALVAAAHK